MLNEALYFFTLLFLLRYLYVYFHKSSDLNRLENFLREVRDLHISVLSRQNHTLNRQGTTLQDVFTLYKEACYAGLSPDQFFTEFQHLLRQSQYESQEKLKVLLALLLRSLVLAFLCIGARIIFHLSGLSTGLGDFQDIDGLCLVSSLLISFVFHSLVFLKHPEAWFWHQGITRRAEEWMKWSLMGEINDDSSYKAVWQELREKELLSGLCMRHGKEELRQLWLKDQEREDKKRLQLFHDVLPLAEVVGLALPTLLIVTAPALSFLN